MKALYFASMAVIKASMQASYMSLSRANILFHHKWFEGFIIKENIKLLEALNFNRDEVEDFFEGVLPAKSLVEVYSQTRAS